MAQEMLCRFALSFPWWREVGMAAAMCGGAAIPPRKTKEKPMKIETKKLLSLPFDASAGMRVDEVRIVHLMDECPDLSYLYQTYSDCEDAEQYKEQDAERLAAYNRGDWYSIGIRAEAVVSYPCGYGSRRMETFRSSGLWGIESDGGAEYIGEIERDQIEDLKNHLAAFSIGFPELQAALA